MSDIEAKLKAKNENIKELFSFNGSEPQKMHIKKNFTNYIRKTQNCPKNFIHLIEHFYKSRPHQHNISRELIECAYSSFPEQRFYRYSQIRHVSRRISNESK